MKKSKTKTTTINVGDDYRIESDELNVTIFQRTQPRRGKLGGTYRPIMYFGSFETALKCLADHHIMSIGVQNLEKVFEEQKKIYKMIEKSMPKEMPVAPL